MKFALVNGVKSKAVKGVKGVCPGCGSMVIPHCGEFKIDHWKHKGKRNCDPWWENETEWHRSWKDNYPDEWQEIQLNDEQTGEKHIADVKTSHGLVIEFQHSHIDPKELTAREKFYQDMVWVVDGTRLKNDFKRFLKWKNHHQILSKGILLLDYPDECFPSTWIESSVPVIFDFQGKESINDIKDVRNQLYCLFPIKIGGKAILTEIPRRAFLKTSNNGEWLFSVKNYMENLMKVKNEWLKQKEKQQNKQNMVVKTTEYILEKGSWKKRYPRM